ncbi:hypothetical protein B9Z55_004789 [Caenorhabditis nigoni]|uniref:Uncharacterized protein n=1 Tax=Caenorhabditis nigoni TaxID=1611254 RepID=A0A2G5UY36_9PELO|nr:hypothetical protein B9Z55_004789 [Caenorhabditis nigoni]
MGEEWTIPENGGQSKAGWTPFAGRKVYGKVHNVVIRREEAFVDERIVATPSFGKNVRLYPHSTSSAHLDHDDELAPTLEPVSENSFDEQSPLHTPPRAHSPIAFPGEFLAKNCISVKNLHKGQINRIFELADRYKHDVEKSHPLPHILQGKLQKTRILLNEAARDMDEELQRNLQVPARSLPTAMHPLPRVDEIAVELDHDERAAYSRQTDGMFIRMSQY